MSLVVWLPLNGDLHNQGLSNITVTNNGATVNTSGKIGSCYSFNGSNNYLYASYNFYNNRYSVCAWIYTTSSSATQTIICDRTAVGSGFSIFLIGGKLRIDCGGNSLQWTTAYTYPINTWFHLTVTYDGNIVYYYINGEFKEKKAQTLASSYWGTITSIGASQTNGSGYGNYLNGKLNDIRIYDHALSAKEVEEIAKGLVLHYKLDQPNQNLLTNDWDLTTWSKESGISVSWDNTVGMYKVLDSSHTSSRWGIYQNITLSANTTYTFSVDGMKKDQNVNFGFAEGTSWPANAGSFTTTMSRLSKTITVGDVDANCRIYLNINPVTDGSNYGYFRAPKLEIGSVATNWKAHTENIIYDSSGYGNNGTIIGSLEMVNNSSRYSCATKFDGSSSAIKVTDNSVMAQDAAAMTINLWARASTWPTTGRLFSCTESGGFNLEGGNSGYWRFPIRVYTNAEKTSTAYKYDSKEIQISVLPTNEWVMLTCVYDSTGTKTYINGELHHTYSNVSYGIYFNINARLFLGCEANTANPSTPYYNGQMSDFRLYYTVLTPQQIKELYNTSMSIDKNGNIYARELVEL